MAFCHQRTSLRPTCQPTLAVCQVRENRNSKLETRQAGLCQPLTLRKRGSGFGARDSQRKIVVWDFFCKPRNPNCESRFLFQPRTPSPEPRLLGWLSAFPEGQQSTSAQAEAHEYLRTAALDKDLQLKILEAVDELDRTVTVRRGLFPNLTAGLSVGGLASKRNSVPLTPTCLHNGRRAADPNIGSALRSLSPNLTAGFIRRGTCVQAEFRSSYPNVFA